MNKLFLLLIIIAGALQLKAQQLNAKPSDPLLPNSPKNLTLHKFTPGDSTLLGNYSTLPGMQQLGGLSKVSSNDRLNGNMYVTKTTSGIDNMPIAKIRGNVDNMPIAKVNDNIDHMPVAKIGGSMVQVVPLVRP